MHVFQIVQACTILAVEAIKCKVCLKKYWMIHQQIAQPGHAIFALLEQGHYT